MRTPSLLLLALSLAAACGEKDDPTDDSVPTDDSEVTDDSGPTDEDGDGFSASEDCDDNNADVNPDATETCDGVDNDCDGLVDDEDDSLDASTGSTFYPDSDGDGYGDPDGDSVEACDAPSGYAAEGDDCDDSEASTNPGATEVCDDGVDNSCSDRIDCDDDDCGGDSACAPALDSVSPSSTPTTAETELTLSGSGFAYLTAGTTTVSLGDEDCAEVAVVDDATLTCTSPSVDEAATVDVTVTNDNGSATLTEAFTWTDCIYVAPGRKGGAGSLYCVDLDAGTVTEVGGIGYALTGMAFSPDGTLYATESTTYGDIGDAHLLTIDLGSGAGSEVGTLYDSASSSDVHQSIPDITFVGSRLVGWSETYMENEIYDVPVEIDVATGEVTQVASENTFGTSNTGLAYDGSATVYLLENGIGGDIIELDSSTGSGTVVSSSDGSYSYGSSGGATFYDGQLYSLDCESTDEGACTLVTVDVTTGALSSVDIELPPGLDAIAAP